LPIVIVTVSAGLASVDRPAEATEMRSSQDHRLPPPVISEVEPGFGAVMLGWPRVKGARRAFFRVYSSDTGSRPWKRMVDSFSGATSVGVRGLENGQQVWLAIRTIRGDKKSKLSAPVAVTPRATWPLGEGRELIGFRPGGFLPEESSGMLTTAVDGEAILYSYGTGMAWYDPATGQTASYNRWAYFADLNAGGDRGVVIGPTGRGGGSDVLLLRPRRQASRVLSHSPEDLVHTVSISDDGTKVTYPVIAYDDEPTAVLHELATDTVRRFDELPGVSPKAGRDHIITHDAVLSGDGGTVALRTDATIHGEPCSIFACVALWDTRTDQVRWVKAADAAGRTDGAMGLAVNRDGTVLANMVGSVAIVGIGPDAASDHVWWTKEYEIVDGSCDRSFYGTSTSIALSASGEEVAFARHHVDCDDDAQVRVEMVVSDRTGEEKVFVAPRVDLPEASRVSVDVEGVGFSADGRFVVSAVGTSPAPNAGRPLRSDVIRWDAMRPDTVVPPE
tara:strand:+ start:7591 stop:9102 length:1512 start_codon:yes stop_codon:yes gene_type:complete